MLTDTLVRPLDALRRGLWRLSARTSLGRACVRDRGTRHTVLLLTHVTLALTLTVLAPLWLLLLAPIVLGVPHVAGDVRYLLVRPILPLGRRGLVLVLGPLAAMTLLRVLPLFGLAYAPWHSAVEVGLGVAAIAGAVAIARTSSAARIGFLALAIALGVVGVLAGRTASLVVAHLHNLVAFGFWLALYRREVPARRLLVVAGAYLGAAALLLTGLCDGLLFAHASGSAAGLDLDYMVASVATGVEPVLAMRLVAFYAFAQSIHYAIWIRLVPQRMDPRPAPPTFARTVGRFREDFGPVGFWLFTAVAIATPLATLVFDAIDVRLVYLFFIVAHGWLELAIFAALGVEAAAPRRAAEAPVPAASPVSPAS